MNTKKTEKRPFDIVIRDAPGQPPRIVETIKVEVVIHGEDAFLTPESSERIERVRARHMGLMIGEDIKSMRERFGLSQKELTDLLQCGEKSLSRWENGRGQPTGIVNKMLRLLDQGILTLSDLEQVSGPRTEPVADWKSAEWDFTAQNNPALRQKPLHYSFNNSQFSIPKRAGNLLPDLSIG